MKDGILYQLVEVPSVPSEVSEDDLQVNIYQLLDVYADCKAVQSMLEGVIERIEQIVSHMEESPCE